MKFQGTLMVLLLVVSICNAEKYPVTIAQGDTTYEGLVEVNVDKGEEIYKTGYTVPEDGSEPKTGLDAPYIVRDVYEKIDATVDEDKGVCYLSAYDATEEISPENLQNDLEMSDGQKVDDDKIVNTQEVEIIEEPIEDILSVSSVIGSHCADKTAYLTVVTKEKTTCDGTQCELGETQAQASCLKWIIEKVFRWIWRCLSSCFRVRIEEKRRVCIRWG
ncbi:uncharacterized protein [Ptychodera flava]|uniref:uncharacterized protein n=1 Tax=Ptychodera flava TaxID=63121 RepID=UPI003969F469